MTQSGRTYRGRYSSRNDHLTEAAKYIDPNVIRRVHCASGNRMTPFATFEFGEKEMQPFDFTSRTVFVAGGTSGINLGIAEAFAEAGAKVAVISRSQERVDEAKRRLQSFGGEVAGFSADVRNVDATSAALKATHDALGDIDILISGAAGNFQARPLGCRSMASRPLSTSIY